MSRALSASPCGLADFRIKGIAGFMVTCSVEFTMWVDLQSVVFEVWLQVLPVASEFGGVLDVVWSGFACRLLGVWGSSQEQTSEASGKNRHNA